MSYKIVFFDIDGTLLTFGDHLIPDSTKEAIALLKKRGVHVVISTGRTVAETVDIAKSLDIHSYVTFNGSHVMHEGKELFKNCIRPNEAESFRKIVEELGHSASFHGLEKTFFIGEEDQVKRGVYTQSDFDVLKRTAQFEEIGDIYKLILYSNPREPYLKEKLNLKFVPWNSRFDCTDILPAQGSKADGVKKMLDYLGVHPSEAAAFGDGLNDVEMLSFVGAGVAMGNAHPGLLPYAAFRTKDIREDGIYHGLRALNLIP